MKALAKLTLLSFVKENSESAIKHIEKYFHLDKFSDEEIFKEFTFCLFVPDGRVDRTLKAIKILESVGYFNFDNEFKNSEVYNLIKAYVRFPRQKCNRLQAVYKLKEVYIKTIQLKVLRNIESKQFREEVIDMTKGFGYKASSHFLRNIGVRDLAIIDTHILKYRDYYMPKKLRTIKPTSKKNYLLLEEYFNKWAETQFNLKPAYLDWLIWCLESNTNITELTY